VAIVTRPVAYRDDDLLLEGLLAWDDAIEGPVPAVAIAPTWAGRGAFEEDRACALAALGYAGFAIDMYGKGVAGGSPEENSALMAPLLADRALLQKRIGRAVAVMREQPEVDASRVAAMGYCFGGLCVLDLARSGSDVAGVASFHGLFEAPGNLGGREISARVLCLHGYDDPMVTPPGMLALADELTAAGADWQIHAYGHTRHAFTNPQANNPQLGAIYDEKADRRSWRALQAFLEELFND
jgi:dienelactone hydrolase